MSKKATITLTCPCDKSYLFQKNFFVEGLGMTEVQVTCPNCQKLLAYEIPWEISRDEPFILRGDGSIPFNPDKKQ